MRIPAAACPTLVLALVACVVLADDAEAQGARPGAAPRPRITGPVGIEDADVEFPLVVNAKTGQSRRFRCLMGFRRGSLDGAAYIDCSETDNGGPIAIVTKTGPSVRCDKGRLITVYATGKLIDCRAAEPFRYSDSGSDEVTAVAQGTLVNFGDDGDISGAYGEEASGEPDRPAGPGAVVPGEAGAAEKRTHQ